MLLIVSHGHIQCHGPFGSGNIAILCKFIVNRVAVQGCQNAVLVKPGHADTVGGAAIFGVSADGSRPNAISCLHREGNGPGGACGGVTPAAGGVIDVFRCQCLPQVGACADLGGKLLQMTVGIKFALGSDHQIAGNIGNADLSVSVGGSRNIHAAHGDGNFISRNRFFKSLTDRNALVIMSGCFCAGQVMGNGIDSVLPCFRFERRGQRIDHGFGNVVHTLGVGVDAIRQHVEGHAAIAQVQILYTVMVADGLDYRAVGIQLCLRDIAGHSIGAHDQDFRIGIEMLQPHNGRHIGIGKGSPLGSRQVHFGGGRGGIKAAYAHAASHIVACPEEQDHIRRAVGTQILDAGQGSHGSIGTQITGIGVLGIQHPGAGPAVIDTQLGIQFLDDLHPPGFIHISQQISLGIPGTMGQIEPIRLRDVPGKGGGAGTENGDDLAGKSRGFFTIGGAHAIFIAMPGRFRKYRHRHHAAQQHQNQK